MTEHDFQKRRLDEEKWDCLGEKEAINENCLRIVTWNINCNQKNREKCFSKKLKRIVDETKADVYVIQECPNPETEDIDFLKDLNLQIPCRSGKDYGVAIFVKEDWTIQRNPETEMAYEYYVSCCISKNNKKMNILGIWAHLMEGKDYPTKLCEFLDDQKEIIDHNCIIAGDLNLDIRQTSSKPKDERDEIYKSGSLMSWKNSFMSWENKHICATYDIYDLLATKKRLESAYLKFFEKEQFGEEEQ